MVEMSFHTTGRERSPRMSHRSAMARKPTNTTTNIPTNLTLTDPANVAPVKDNQNHQEVVKALAIFILKKLKQNYY